MSSWGNNDNAANAPRWAVTTSAISLKANSNNVSLLFGNTTPNAFRSNLTMGLYGLDANNIAGIHGAAPGVGWVLEIKRTVGGVVRTTWEVLVATNSMLGGGSSPANPNTYITITTQPASNSAVHGVGNTVTFYVVASSSNPSDPLVYNWYYANTTGIYTPTSGNTAFTGNTSNTLVVNATTVANNGLTVFCSITSPAGNAATQNSSIATVTIT